ncbi:MAG: cytochrome c-type biogenesis protein CcmH [Alicyclobacillaceae bacterium]|nr:cytochrome c-type biogenesis protein CcmH [Alicyclobacillaceae bacterium]
MSRSSLRGPFRTGRAPAVALAALLLWAASPAGPEAAFAQQRNVTWQEVLDVAAEYHPPGCPPTLTGATCQERQAFDLRLEILKLLEEGKSRQEIRQILVSKYGQDILAAPPPKGFGVLVWAAPVAAVAFGLSVFFLMVRRRRPSPPAGG